MVFNSLEFFGFFLITTPLLLFTHGRLRNFILFVASCAFYIAGIPKFIFALFALILLDFYAGMVIDRFPAYRRHALILSLAGNLGLLGFFKYYNFFASNLSDAAQLLGFHLSPHLFEVILPIGLSFHTFQSMAYIFDVYSGKTKAEKDILTYAVYVLFYPQLVAGPIERPNHLLPQLHHPQPVIPARVIEGAKQFCWGLFKKVVVADRLALVVNFAYASPGSHDGYVLAIATIFFTYQIYCDFSGYTDMALGIARALGYDLAGNFNFPYASASFSDFWRRWHISLSGWFRDYVYIPLGGNRHGFFLNLRNIFIVFLLSGLWHGANWTYIIWGGLHGTYLALENAGKRLRAPTLPKALAIPLVFTLTAIAWVFFRANTTTDAWTVINKIFSEGNLIAGIGTILKTKEGLASELIGISKTEFLLNICLISFLEIVQWRQRVARRVDIFTNPALRWIGWNLIVAMILFLGQFTAQQFIYFQF